MKRVYSAIKSLSHAKNLIANNAQKFSANRKITILSLFAAALLLGSANPLLAQTTNTKQTTTASVAPAAAGTYQLIFNNRNQDADIKLNTQQLIVVENLRKDTEVVYARAAYSDDIRVKILPRNVINQPDFKPLPLKYYKEEHDYNEWGQIRYVEFE